MMNSFKASLYSWKGTALAWVHLLLPLGASLLFSLAWRGTSLRNLDLVKLWQLYLMALGGALPTVIAAVTGAVAAQEEGAGHYQNLLTLPSRSRTYLGKLLLLWLGGSLSLGLALLLFALMNPAPRGTALLTEFLLLSAGTLAPYAIHFWLSLKWGGGASLGLGLLASLLCLISYTALGDGLWYYFPGSWAGRLAATHLVARGELWALELSRWLRVGPPVTGVLLLASFLWFCRCEEASLRG
ncbi:MAG: lantibiotic immunity ABC transporter MutG family permease subunit [Tissierellia bacterium]|nr:lantibiotic immunity ABC transporter MutG family permease subunit [Tissierellia bacterium]